MKKSVIYLLLMLMILNVSCGLKFDKNQNGHEIEEIGSISKDNIERDISIVSETIEDDITDELIEESIEYIEESIEEVDESIELVFGGDVYFSDYVLNAYDNGAGISGILSSDLIEELRNADVAMVNSEFCFSNGGVAQDKQYTFRIDPKRAKIYKELGVDIVTLANNHSLDYGREALEDTMDTFKNLGIPYVGAGKNLKEASDFYAIEVKGKILAFLGATRVIPEYSWNATKDTSGLFTTYDPTLLLEQIKKAEEVSDYVIVYVHWGIERKTEPENYQVELAKAYIDAGADVVVGAHPHVLQRIEFYNGKPIFYSLGNFIFGSSIPESEIVKVKLENNNISVDKMMTSSGNGYTKNTSEWIAVE